MKLQLPKGTRDFPPEEKIMRDKVVNTLTKIFERYGFSPLETPIFERFDVLAGKYTGGSEILKETFKFTDQGDRELALRYDLTVPFSRFVGMNPQLKMPFKRYAIGKVFRDGPIKLGRYREFYQCDVDVVGNKKMIADAELIRLAKDVFEELELEVIVYFNNRKLLEDLLRKAGVKESQLTDAMLTLDKLKKAGVDGIKTELKEKGIPENSVDFIVGISDENNSSEKRLELIKEYLGEDSDSEGLKEITELLSYLEKVSKVVFDPSLARGLAYYTSTVYEVFMSSKDSVVKSAVSAGGRYDKMIGSLLGSKLEFPAVGISFGLEPITDVMKSLEKNEQKTVTKLLIVPIKTAKESLEIASEIRKLGVNTDIVVNKKGVTKGLEFANSYNIPYVAIIGPKELEAKKIKLKNMATGEEEELTLKEIAKKLK